MTTMDDIREQHRQELRWHLAEEYGPRLEFLVDPERKSYIKPIINIMEPTELNKPAEAPKTKVCPRCGRELPISDFGRHARTKDGLQPICRECRSKAGMERPLRARNDGSEPIPVIERTVVHNTAIDAFNDYDLVKELRRRGYEVTATKTVVL